MTIASNIVVEWLHSLHLGEYAESFIDNGYDDLEICKQISEPDLDAIGVFKQSHRLRLLQSVKRLREEGAASVYFTLEESSACLCEEFNVCEDKDDITTPSQTRPSPYSYEIGLAPHQTFKFLDEYEEGKAELVRIPRMQLRLLLQEKLRSDGIHLACQPYTTPEGERGYLEGLASRYADILKTHYGDVLEPLEELRRREMDSSPKISNSVSGFSPPAYIPGKYSPSSCLSDKEEDEIYGFGYGVFGRQMLQQREQKQSLTKKLTISTDAIGHNQPVYQSCLSPRSAFFYEFPPNEQGQNTQKKKMTFSRILRSLKTHKKEKYGQSLDSPRHGPLKIGLPQRLKMQDSTKNTELVGSRERNEVLKDTRRGMLLLNRDAQGLCPRDDTYMYDEEVRCESTMMLGKGGKIHHWYDEPPYESDPEDFLMNCTATTEIDSKIPDENIRTCRSPDVDKEIYTEAVISLPTAGDISLPKDRTRKLNSTMRGLIVPQGYNNPPTIIPLTHSRTSRDSGEYANSDVQIGERVSINDNSSHENTGMTISNIAGRARTLRQDVQRKISRLRYQRGSINEVAFPCSASSIESLPSGSGSSSTQALVRAGSNHSSISCEEREPVSPQRIEHHTGVTASNTPSGSIVPSVVLCRAKALVDCLPSPYDKDALAFKKGDIIDVLQMNASGLWKGATRNHVGYFKFINVEIINERIFRRGKWGRKYRQKPGSVPELLQRMNLQEYISVFLLNGYEDLELFRELEPTDLDYLRIHHPEHRSKILTAVQLLHDLQSGSDGDELEGSSSDDDDLASIRCDISRLKIDRKHLSQQMQFENNLNCHPSDNQRLEYEANVPTHLLTSNDTTNFENLVEE